MTMKVPEGQHLLTKNIFKTNGKRALFSNLDEKVSQRPNKKIFDLFPLDLILYNRSDPKLDEAFTAYFSISEGHRDGKEKKTMDSLLLKYGLNNYINKNLWWDKFLFKNGEKPVIIDSAATAISANNIDLYYHFKGFFDAKTTVDFKLKNKKGKVTYNTETGAPYSIRSIEYRFKEPELEKIVQKDLLGSRIKKGDIFDEENFKEELDRVTTLYQNKGYYNFNPSNEDIFFEINAMADNHQMDVKMNVNEKTVEEEGVKKRYPHKKYKFKEIKVKFKTNRTTPVTPIIHQGYKLFLPPSLKYKPRAITDAILIGPGNLYRERDIVSTKKKIYSLKNFSIKEFTVEEIPSDPSDPKGELNTSILLSPLKRYEIKLSFETVFSDFINLGISPGISLLTRNIFSGAENLELSFKGNLTSMKKNSRKTNAFFNAREAITQAKIHFPRFLLPFNTEHLIPKCYKPRSAITARINMQRNVGIGRLNFSNILDYEWKIFPYETYKFELLNLQFIKNLEKNRYFDFYDNDRGARDVFCKEYARSGQGGEEDCLNNNDETYAKALEIAQNLRGYNIDSNILSQYLKMQSRRARIIDNYIIHSISYAYEYNKTLDKRKKKSIFLRTRVETAGNLLSLPSNPLSFYPKKIGEQEPYTIFNVPYSQFIKIDLDFRKYWNLSDHKTLAFRIFIGAAFPYGKSIQLPFDRSYFGGGSNDIRAWRAYDLGPGNTSNFSRDLSFSDLKLTLNSEYRFKIMSNIYSSVFLDAGNIWSLKGEYTSDSGKFRWNRFYKQLALGGGIGFRYDLKFIIARVDLAYKLQDPSRPLGERWLFNKLGIGQTVVNFAVGYPF
ncbi:MAG: BamA/TamA family outer membrane protein [Flavobacteriales bacterium Tduv]